MLSRNVCCFCCWFTHSHTPATTASNIPCARATSSIEDDASARLYGDTRVINHARLVVVVVVWKASPPTAGGSCRMDQFDGWWFLLLFTRRTVLYNSACHIQNQRERERHTHDDHVVHTQCFLLKSLPPHHYYYYASKMPPRNAGWPSMMTVVLTHHHRWLAGWLACFCFLFKIALRGEEREIHSVGEWQTIPRRLSSSPAERILLLEDDNPSRTGGQNKNKHMLLLLLCRRSFLYSRTTQKRRQRVLVLKNNNAAVGRVLATAVCVIALGCSSRRDEQAARLFWLVPLTLLQSACRSH